MIDDRLDVRSALKGTVACRYLFGRQKGPAPEGVRHTLTWADVEAAVTADL